jgi:hypothetical protein
MPQGPSLVRLGLVVGWSFIVLSVVWLRFAPTYNEALVSSANVFLPGDLWLAGFGDVIRVTHLAGGQEYRQDIDALVLHSGLLIVLALIAGTPSRSWLWRLFAGAMITGLFFLIQVVAMAVFATMLKRSLGPEVLEGDVQIAFAIFWALTPLSVGVAWAYRFWLPAFHPPPHTPAQPDAPESSSNLRDSME